MANNKEEYDRSANIWILSRSADSIDTMDPKMLKQNRPHLFIEKPAMTVKVPDLKGKRVLALGCGSGEEIELLKSKGAKDIVGIDISEELIKHAQKDHPDCEFHVMDGAKMTFGDDEFGYVFSSLVMHYFEKWDDVLGHVFRVMRNGGKFLFSIVHPVKWSAQKVYDEDGKATATVMGFQNDPTTGEEEILGDYLNTVKLTETWMRSLTVTFYPRSISSSFRSLKDAGFNVLDLIEPKTTEETKKYDMNYYKRNQRIPNFLIFEAQKQV